MLMAGWLVKQGGIWKGYRRRFFILDDQGVLSYYKDKSDLSHPAGTIDIAQIMAARVSENNPIGKGAAFDVVTPQRTYYLIADNEEDMKLWIQAIGNAKIMREHPNEGIRLERPMVQYTDQPKSYERPEHVPAQSTSKLASLASDAVSDTADGWDDDWQDEWVKPDMDESEANSAHNSSSAPSTASVSPMTVVAAAGAGADAAHARAESPKLTSTSPISNESAKESEIERERREKKNDKEAEERKNSLKVYESVRRIDFNGFSQRNQQIQCFSRWLNVQLDELGSERRVSGDLVSSLNDGEVLVTVIYGLMTRSGWTPPEGEEVDSEQSKELSARRDTVGSQARVARLKTCINTFRRSTLGRRAYCPPTISAPAIMSGNLKIILDLVWAVAYSFLLADADSSENGINRLMEWARLNASTVLPTEPIVDTRSFGDGRAYAAILQAHDVMVIQTDALPAYKATENLEKVFDIAERRFGVPRLLDAADSVDPDECAVLLYLATMRQRLMENW